MVGVGIGGSPSVDVVSCFDFRLLLAVREKPHPMLSLFLLSPQCSLSTSDLDSTLRRISKSLLNQSTVNLPYQTAEIWTGGIPLLHLSLSINIFKYEMSLENLEIESTDLAGNYIVGNWNLSCRV